MKEEIEKIIDNIIWGYIDVDDKTFGSISDFQ